MKSDEQVAQQDWMRDILDKAGVLPSEIMEHPDYGLCISPSGVRKLCAFAPDQSRVPDVMNMVAEVVRSTFKVVE